MFFSATQRIKQTIVEILRRSFNTNPDYRWSSDISQAGITIYTAFPLQRIKYPAIVVTSVTGDALLRTMNDEVIEEERTDVSIDGITHGMISSINYSGGFRFTVNIDVAAEESIRRDEILDWVLMYLRVLFKDKLVQEGIHVSGMRVLGERQVLVGTDYVYFQGIGLEVYSEWRHDIPVDVVETLQGISMMNFPYSVMDGSTYFENY